MLIFRNEENFTMTSFEKNSIIIRQICDTIEPGKKMLQKLMYLISRKDVNLELNYSIHYFGPYSSKLDSTLHTLESFDKLSINTSGITHIIHLGDSPIEGTLDHKEQESVDFVLKNFSMKSAHELEAITTIDYVATKMLKNQAKDEDIIAKVQQIKGTKFSKEYLQDCLQILKKLDYIA